MYGIGELSSNLRTRKEPTKLKFIIDNLLRLASLRVGRTFNGGGYSFGRHLNLGLESVLDGSLDGLGSSLDRRLDDCLGVGCERNVDRSPTRGHELVLQRGRE